MQNGIYLLQKQLVYRVDLKEKRRLSVHIFYPSLLGPLFLASLLGLSYHRCLQLLTLGG